MLFRNVSIESVAAVEAPRAVPSAELEARLDATLRRLKLPPHPIDLLTGIAERRFWEPGTPVHAVATQAGRRAVELSGVDPARIGLLVSTSVSKEYLEPSTASLVHGDLGLPPTCRNLDVANACLGFMNGMELAGQLLDAGVVEYALVVDGESSGDIVEYTLARLSRPDATATEFWSNFATLTLGSAGVAMVLGRADASRTGHRVNGSVSLADTANNRLCLGTAERMETDSTRLLKAGVALAQRTWARATETLPGWSASGIDRYVCHQVGRAHLAAVCQALGIPQDRCPLSYPRYGNVGPAAVPMTLALAAGDGSIRPGDHVALMGIGSGINVSMMSVTW